MCGCRENHQPVFHQFLLETILSVLSGISQKRLGILEGNGSLLHINTSLRLLFLDAQAVRH